MSYKTGFYEGRLGIGLGSTMGMGDGNPRYSLDINGDIRLTGSIVNGDGQILSLTPPEFDPAGLDGNNSLIYNFEKQGTHTGSQNILIGKHAGTDLTSGNNNICLGIEAGSNLTAAHHHIALGYYALRNCTDRTNAIMIGQQAGREFSGGDYCIGIGPLAMYNPAGSHNIAMGYSAMQGASGTQSHTGNTALGFESLKALTSGGYNVAIGYQIGNKITSGSNNVLLGFQTGLNLTNGGNNIFLGTASGYNGSSANNNIAIGDYVMYGHTVGVNNIAIGNRCLYNGPDHSGGDTGKYNVAIGYYCAYSITTGYNNVFMGMNAGNSTTSGYNNVSIGAYATTNINSGYANTCIGYNAGRHMTTGYYNTCIGYATGYELTNGYQNVMIGMEAGYYSNTAAVGNIFIGRFTGPKSSDGNHHNRLAIGAPGGTNSDTYRGYDGAFLWGDFNSTTLSSRYLRISGRLGVACTPAYPLQVNGYTQMPSWSGYYVQTGSAAASTGSGQMITIQAQYGIWVGSHGLVVSSDQRIKTNISEVPDNLSLQKLRDISCCYYEYKDKLGRGSEKTIGFIAQQVKEHMPMAVGIQKDILPNEMRILTNISWEEITDNSSNQYKLTTDLQDVSGVKYRFYVINDPSGNDECEKEIIGNEDNTFTFDSSYNNVFCYGKEVNDFHTLDKAKLFSLNFSATQELDRKVIALENENAELKAELATIKQHLGI